jgi:hypothetical protein
VWAVLETSQVFAPRYMFGTVELLCIDVAMFVGLWLGIGQIVSRITRMFVLPEQSAGSSSRTAAEGQQ